jgi:hypothetical protein
MEPVELPSLYPHCTEILDLEYNSLPPSQHLTLLTTTRHDGDKQHYGLPALDSSFLAITMLKFPHKVLESQLT